MSEVEAENMERFRAEILLMRDLRHDNIVVMVGAVWSEKLMALVLEFCEHGSIADWLKANKGNQVVRLSSAGSSLSTSIKMSKISWGDPLFAWVLGISMGLDYIHSISYVDVKTGDNIEVR